MLVKMGAEVAAGTRRRPSRNRSSRRSADLSPVSWAAATVGVGTFTLYPGSWWAWLVAATAARYLLVMQGHHSASSRVVPSTTTGLRPVDSHRVDQGRSRLGRETHRYRHGHPVGDGTRVSAPRTAARRQDSDDSDRGGSRYGPDARTDHTRTRPLRRSSRSDRCSSRRCHTARSLALTAGPCRCRDGRHVRLSAPGVRSLTFGSASARPYSKRDPVGDIHHEAEHLIPGLNYRDAASLNQRVGQQWGHRGGASQCFDVFNRVLPPSHLSIVGNICSYVERVAGMFVGRFLIGGVGRTLWGSERVWHSG